MTGRGKDKKQVQRKGWRMSSPDLPDAASYWDRLDFQSMKWGLKFKNTAGIVRVSISPNNICTRILCMCVHMTSPFF